MPGLSAGWTMKGLNNVSVLTGWYGCIVLTAIYLHVLIAGTSPVTYTGLSKGRYRINIQAACPGQRFRDGSRKRVRFEIHSWKPK